MFNLKKFVWFISAFALFSFVVAGQHAEAGPYEGVKLLLDGHAPAEDDAMMAMMFGDRVNDNVTRVVPPAAGDTVSVEIYVSDAPAGWTGFSFGFDDTDGVFSDNFTADTLMVDPDAGIQVGMGDAGAEMITLVPYPFKDNKLLGVFTLIANRDIPEGTTLSVGAAVVATVTPPITIDLDSLDVSMAMITFKKEPPKLEGMDMGGMMIADPVVVKRDSAAVPDTITVTASNFAEGDTITWNIEETGTFDITVVDQEGMMMEEAMFPTTGTTIKVYAKGMGDAGSVSIFAYSGMDTTNTVTIEFSLEKEPPKLGVADAGGMMVAEPVVVKRDSAAAPDTITVTALNFAEGDTITWNIEETGTFDITVVDEEGMMMEEAMFPTTGTTIKVYATGTGDAGSVSIYAYSGADTTNTVTIEFSLEEEPPKLGVADAGGMMVAEPVAVKRDSAAAPDTITVTALNFAEGDTITWNIEETGTFDITVVDEEGMMMEEAMFPTTGTTIQVYATGTGDAGSVSIFAYSGADTTNTVTIEFSLEEEEPKLGVADAGGMMVAEPVVVKRDSAAAPDTITVTASNFAEGDTITWNIEETGTFDITVVDEEGMMMEEAMFPTTGTTIKVYATGTGDAGSVSIYAYSGADTTNTVTIEFKQPKPKLESADAGGMMIADPVAVSRDADAPPDTVTVTALNFAEGDTITWNVMKAGAFDITVVDQEGMMMEEAMFPTTGTTIQVYAKGTGDAGSVSIYAYSGMDTTNTVTIEFSLENPVELASFGGELAEDRVVLNWTTASQTNNAGWRMLRSVDGETYEAIGEFVSGAGTSDVLVSYNFVDNNPPSAEKVFYMLEQVDLDGTIHRSNAVEVTLGARFVDVPTEFATNVYPNPFNPSTTISYDLPSDALISIVIYDAIGQVVRQLVNEQRFAGRYQVRWDAKDNLGRSVGSGVYIAKVEAGSFSASQKMLLLK